MVTSRLDLPFSPIGMMDYTVAGLKSHATIMSISGLALLPTSRLVCAIDKSAFAAFTLPR